MGLRQELLRSQLLSCTFAAAAYGGFQWSLGAPWGLVAALVALVASSLLGAAFIASTFEALARGETPLSGPYEAEQIGARLHRAEQKKVHEEDLGKLATAVRTGSVDPIIETSFGVDPEIVEAFRSRAEVQPEAVKAPSELKTHHEPRELLVELSPVQARLKECEQELSREATKQDSLRDKTSELLKVFQGAHRLVVDVEQDLASFETLWERLVEISHHQTQAAKSLRALARKCHLMSANLQLENTKRPDPSAIALEVPLEELAQHLSSTEHQAGQILDSLDLLAGKTKGLIEDTLSELKPMVDSMQEGLLPLRDLGFELGKSSGALQEIENTLGACQAELRDLRAGPNNKRVRASQSASRKPSRSHAAPEEDQQTKTAPLPSMLPPPTPLQRAPTSNEAWRTFLGDKASGLSFSD